MTTRNVRRNLARIGMALVVVLSLSLISAQIAQAAPPAQDPRPPVEREGRDDESEANGAANIACASVSGEIINWGYRPEPGILTRLQSGSWEVSDKSTDDGLYGFSGLGVGIARLNVSLAPTDPLKPVTPDAVVYLNCDYPTIANLGLFTGPTVEPPVMFSMSTPNPVISAGRQTDLTLTIENALPTEISNAIVTNLIPPGLVALEVSASTDTAQQNARIINGGDDGQVAVIFLDTVAAGETVDIVITVTAIEDTPVTGGTSTATLFYRESVAVQASLDYTIGQGNLAIPAASTTGAETSGPAARESTVTTDAAPEIEAEAGDETAGPAREPAAEEAAPSSTTTTPTTEQAGTTTDEAGPASQPAEEPSDAFEPPGDPVLPVTGQGGADPALSLTAGGATSTPKPVLTLPVLALALLLLGTVLVYGLKQVRPTA